MAGKVIRDYVPGENDFLHFAEVMNKNAAIDMRNPSSVGKPTPSPRGEGLAGGANTPQGGEGSDPSTLRVVSPTRAGAAVMPAVQGRGEVLSGSAQYDKLRGDFKATGGKI